MSLLCSGCLLRILKRFNRQYAATDAFLPPPLEPGETKIAYAKRVSSLMKEKLIIEEDGPASTSIDLVVDASGAETCIQIGALIAKRGGIFIQVRSLITKATCLLNISRRWEQEATRLQCQSPT